MQSTLQVIEAPEQAAALLDSTRLGLLEKFREPRSAAEAARELAMPRQRVGHHVRLLRQRGLLEAVGERRKGNFVEQLLQATARSYVIAPQALGPLGVEPARIADRLSASYLLASAVRTIREVSAAKREAESRGRRLATFTIESEICFSSPRVQGEFVRELAACAAELARKYHDESVEGGRSFRLVLAGHPAHPGEEPEDVSTTNIS